MDILNIPMPKNDSGAKTIGGYLIALLERVWEEGEGFSGKRPFGNSGWDHDIYAALVKAEAVKGKIDSDGCLEECDEVKANKLIFVAIDSMGKSRSDLIELLKEIANSDMAQREEDEGQVSPLLKKVRAAIKGA